MNTEDTKASNLSRNMSRIVDCMQQSHSIIPHQQSRNTQAPKSNGVDNSTLVPALTSDTSDDGN
jgi:hypothetical protein